MLGHKICDSSIVSATAKLLFNNVVKSIVYASTQCSTTLPTFNFLRFLKVRYTARTTKMLTFITEFTAISHHCRSLFLHIVLCYCLADFYYDQKVFLLHFLQGKSNVNDVLQLFFSGNILICISALRTFSSYKILLTILSFNTLNLTTYCLSKVSD